jgi:hypothetical protein
MRDVPSIGGLDEVVLERGGEAPQGRAPDTAAVEGKWSPRRTLLFILTVCGGFWAAVIAAALMLAR